MSFICVIVLYSVLYNNSSMDLDNAFRVYKTNIVIY